MQLFKRLLRAHWSIISLLCLSSILLIACIGWSLSKLLWNSPASNMKFATSATLGLCALVLAGLALKNRLQLLMLLIFIPKLRRSLPRPERDATLEGLDEPVEITLDQFGIPTIKARSRLDAMRALGYVSARDRLFQMDLLRRGAAGRLTEVFGKGLLEMDTAQRIIGCNRVAAEVVALLPQEQKETLRAYSEGVNAYLSQMKRRPFEFLLLKYHPENWSIEDCVLALLRMFQNLCAEEEGKRRTLAIMESALPSELVAFLTPDAGPYTTSLGWGHESHRPVRPFPHAEVASLLLRQRTQTDSSAVEKKIVRTEGVAAGSNCWVVDKSKTATGTAILANDMHTGLEVPNLWYRARLCYDGVDLNGLIIPGIPLVLAGSNTHVAWGLTNMLGACLELVQLEVDPERPDHYMTPEGLRPFELINELVKRKRGDFVNVEVKKTIWGPVLEKTLMGRQVALRWTALDPLSVNFGLMHMETARTVEDAVRVVNHFAGPPLNVLVADEQGRIAYTVCGRLPARKERQEPESDAQGNAGWTNYIGPDELPGITESSEGFLVSANNMSVGREYPYLLGEGFPHSYRAYRIAERLREMKDVSEPDMFGLQCDTVCHIFEFYRQLALRVLTGEAVARDSELAIVRRAILAWDERAGLESSGLIFIIHFRDELAQAVFTPMLRDCAEADERFVYAWPNLDTPLRIILTEQPTELLAAEPEGGAAWDVFVLGNLKGSVARLKETLKVKSLENLNWGKVNRAEVFHLLTPKDRSLLGNLFNMPDDPLPGCLFSVCASEPGFGASMRMVVSPGRENAGFMHIACGQSGHPLSNNYDDQHHYWSRQDPLPFLPGSASHTFTLAPRSNT